VAHFKRSSHAVHLLKKAQKDKNVTTGIVSIGKTRFGTLYWAGNSVLKNHNAIVEYARALTPQERKQRLGQDMMLWAGDADSVLELRLMLSRFLQLLEPIARSLTCLESSHSTAADLFLFWLAAATGLDDQLRKHSYPSSIKAQIRKLVNARFTEMTHSGPSDPYLAALFFHIGTHFVIYSISGVLIEPHRVSRLSSCSISRRWRHSGSSR
jgi:hypothetical protein